MLPGLRPIGVDSRGRERTPEHVQVGDWSKLVARSPTPSPLLENRVNRVQIPPPRPNFKPSGTAL